VLRGRRGILDVVGGIASAGLFGIPVCMSVAVLRYRLFDIDRIISRTLAYAIVTGLLAGVYAGLVLLATRVLPVSSPVAVAGATLAAAAASRQVIAVELQGHGHTADTGRPMTIQALAGDVVALLDHPGIAEADHGGVIGAR